MKEAKRPFYRYCLVPLCQNTSMSAPNKVFFSVPRDATVRKQWCKIIRRDVNISAKSCLHCCEDHFDLELDTANYMEYKIMNLQGKEKTTLRLKKGVLPHKFECQQTKRKLSSDKQINNNKKRKRHQNVKEISSETDAEKDTSNFIPSKNPETNIYIKETTSS